jgi:hypothetical protein
MFELTVFLLNMLEVDKAVFDGKKQEAVALLESMIPGLRGYKLLTAVRVRKKILVRHFVYNCLSF